MFYKLNSKTSLAFLFWADLYVLEISAKQLFSQLNKVLVSQTVLNKLKYLRFSSDLKLSESNNSTSLLLNWESSMLDGIISILRQMIVILRFWLASNFFCSISLQFLSSNSASISIKASFCSSSQIFCLRTFIFSSSWSKRAFSSLHQRFNVVLASARRAFSSIRAETTTTSFALTEL